MFCKNCGTQIADGSTVCTNCQQPVVDAPHVVYQATPNTQTHSVPKCTCCGYEGEMKPGPILTTNDWIWFFMLLFMFGAGFIFLIYKLITRADPKKRGKVCPNCKSKNMYTYVY